jgi:hypothetical protein
VVGRVKGFHYSADSMDSAANGGFHYFFPTAQPHQQIIAAAVTVLWLRLVHLCDFILFYRFNQCKQQDLI